MPQACLERQGSVSPLLPDPLEETSGWFGRRKRFRVELSARRPLAHKCRPINILSVPFATITASDNAKISCPCLSSYVFPEMCDIHKALSRTSLWPELRISFL